jgi:hypothetical protein
LKVTEPASGVVDAIAGFVAAQGVEKLRERRRLVSEETKSKVIDLEKAKEAKTNGYAFQKQMYAAGGTAAPMPGGVRGAPGGGSEVEVPSG